MAVVTLVVGMEELDGGGVVCAVKSGSAVVGLLILVLWGKGVKMFISVCRLRHSMMEKKECHSSLAFGNWGQSSMPRESHQVEQAAFLAECSPLDSRESAAHVRK